MPPPPTLAVEERAALEAVEGIVFDIQRYSVHDGPGLRANVFLKGCPLRCRWCAKCQSQNMQARIGPVCAQLHGVRSI